MLDIMKDRINNLNGIKYNTDVITLPFISVIIPAYNEEKMIGNAIEAALKQSYPKDKMEIIVVDDGSTDKTCDVVSQYPVKLFKHDKNRGDSAARNTGAKNAKGEIIATTDADDKVDKNWLINIVKHYEEANVGSVVGGSHISFDDKNWQQRIIGELIICGRGDDFIKNVYDTKGKVSSNKSIGSNQSFKKSVFDEIGGFDMGLTAGMEQDIIWRIEKTGYKVVFEPSAKVYISPRDNFKKYIKQGYSHARGGAIIYFKHPDKVTLRYLFSALYLPIIIIILISLVISNIMLFMYLVMMILVLPLGYYFVKLFKKKQQIKKIVDMFFIPIIGYISFISACLGILRGGFDMRGYKEKLTRILKKNPEEDSKKVL